MASEIAGLFLGLAILAGLAVTERERTRAPHPVPAVSAQGSTAYAPRCAVQSASVVIWYEAGAWRERVVNRRTASEPCWYKAPLGP